MSEKEVERIEKHKARAGSGKRKRINYITIIKEVQSAVQHVSKNAKTKLCKIEGLMTL